MKDCVLIELVTLSSNRLTPGCEDTGLACFGMVTLDDADTSEGFGEATGDLCIDARPFTKDGPGYPKGIF